MNAPRCHTYLEIIHVRYGRVAHVVFIFFVLVTVDQQHLVRPIPRRRRDRVKKGDLALVL
jgi:hypothetical protein